MSRLRPVRIVALVVTLVLTAAACGQDEPAAVIISGNNPISAPRDIFQTAVAAELDTLVAAVEAAGLTDTLSDGGPFTVFAPSEAAFGDLPDGLIDLLLEDENSDLLTDILTYHVADGLQRADALLESGRVTTIEGSALTIREVVVPAQEEDAEPTVETRVGDARVTSADRLATNGVIHVIDTVLVPPDRADDLADLIDEITETVDIVATAEAAGEFTKLLEYLDAAGLTDTLSGDGDFTVFAPTDAAFAELSEDEVAALADTDVLTSVLLFHVLNRPVRTTDVLTQTYVTTLETSGARFVRVITRTPIGDVDPDDEDAEIEYKVDTHFEFNGVTLSVTDIEATNGVIHVIDVVLVPDSARGPGGF